MVHASQYTYQAEKCVESNTVRCNANHTYRIFS